MKLRTHILIDIISLITAFCITLTVCTFIEAVELKKTINYLSEENFALKTQIDTLTANSEKAKEKQERQIEELTKQIETLSQEVSKLRASYQQVKSDRSGDRVRYNLTDTERDLVERVVMAESGGECFEGQMLVCQCILNACEIDGIRPQQVIKKYAYAKGRPAASDSVKRAVSEVFDRGETVTQEPIVYFYAPKVVRSEFHERQRFVLREGNHKFFAERE